MKINQISATAFWILIAFTLAFTSCKKDDDPAETVTEEEAAEAIGYAVSSETAGMTEQIETSVAIASEQTSSKNDYCGMSFDTTFAKTNPAGTVITYEYSFAWDWVINCNNMQVPENFVFSYELNGWYNAPRMYAEDTGTHSFEVSGLEPSAAEWIYNGTYDREGYNESKIGQQRSFSSELHIEALNVSLSKETGKITGGTANVMFYAETSGGKTFTYSGTITFTGGDTATLMLENEYVIEL